MLAIHHGHGVINLNHVGKQNYVLIIQVYSEDIGLASVVINGSSSV